MCIVRPCNDAKNRWRRVQQMRLCRRTCGLPGPAVCSNASLAEGNTVSLSSSPFFFSSLLFRSLPFASFLFLSTAVQRCSRPFSLPSEGCLFTMGCGLRARCLALSFSHTPPPCHLLRVISPTKNQNKIRGLLMQRNGLSSLPVTAFAAAPDLRQLTVVQTNLKVSTSKS